MQVFARLLVEGLHTRLRYAYNALILVGRKLHKEVVELVERSRARHGYGTQILINHGFGYKTRYAHLNKLHVAKGDTITRGQLIGDMGNTGVSTSPHLHYEVIYKRSHVNPINYFDRNMSAEAYKSLMNQIQEANYEAE